MSEEAQDARSLARDGHLPDEHARVHLGETVLDEAQFDVRIDTDALTSDQVLDLAWSRLLALRPQEAA